MRQAISAAVITFLIGVAGCESVTGLEDSTKLEKGTFRADVDDGIQRTMMGSAVTDVGGSARSDRTVWFLDLDDEPDQIFLALGVDSVPEPRTYPIISPPEFSDEDVLEDGAAWMFFTLNDDSKAEDNFPSNSGDLVIEESSPEEIRGRITVTTQRSVSGEFEPVSVTATFRASPRFRIDLQHTDLGSSP